VVSLLFDSFWGGFAIIIGSFWLVSYFRITKLSLAITLKVFDSFRPKVLVKVFCGLLNIFSVGYGCGL